MFKIESVITDDEAKTLVLSDRLFHDALKDKPSSKTRYHVKNDKGDDFDIVYWDNNDDIEPLDAYPAYVKPPFMDKYLVYDEHDKDTIYLDFFNGLKRMMFEELNEYTIAITKVVLDFTDLEVWCMDDRILWFVDENPRLHIVEEFPEDKFADDCFYIQEQIRVGMEDNNFNRLSNTYAFHNIFFIQWILNGKSFTQFKYITMPISNVGGIGALLSGYKRYQKAFEYFGLKFSAPDKDHFGKYPRKLVERYFSVNLWNEDASDENTLKVPDIVMFVKTKFYNMQPGLVDKSVIADKFMEEMDEYYDAVFGEKRTLGILIRGTDYIATGLSGTRKMANVEQMIPTIRQWMTDYGYEKIFLATEDADILSQMRKEFGKTMVALSQQRLSRNDLRTGQIISEYEKEHGGDDYAEKMEDTTVNYFYALYILSRCNAFMCSGQCNGWDTVLSLNENKYERAYKFKVGIDGDPRTEGWNVIRPLTAGMFARGTYPTDKAFFMTYRFDLHESVDRDALKQAWDRTVKVYPYVGYAIVTRSSQLVLAENPLPFIIKETGEVVEPFGAEGNFHSVTLCYLGNTLWMYVDHVPYDGTGFMKVVETFFYNYYCLYDGCEYPVPEGVYTEKDGVVEGQDIDGYLMVDPIDPKKMMGALGASKSFCVPENSENSIFVPKQDCRGFCISVAADEFMNYAKSVKGSPMSVFNICFAKALGKVHPENTLPIDLMNPVSIRKIMGNENSLLHQVVHTMYTFDTKSLADADDVTLNTQYREHLKKFCSEENIKMLSGVYRGICEGYTKAFMYGALDKIIIDQRKSMKGKCGVSYIGTMKTGDYGNRIRMTAFHAMQEKGIMLQVTEISGVFYIDWYQGFHGEEYVKAMRDVLSEAGIKGIRIDRVE